MAKKERIYSEDEMLDKYSLDEEFEKMVTLYKYWGDKYAEARANRVRTDEILKLEKSDAKAELEEEIAKIDLDIRTNFEEYDFDKKPTENAIRATIFGTKRYLKAKEKFNQKVREAIDKMAEAVREKESYYAAREGMKIKSQSLSELRKLVLANYYSRKPIEIESKGKKQRKSLNR